MADEADSKSVVGNHVRVQVPLPAGEEQEIFCEKGFLFVYLRKTAVKNDCSVEDKYEV